MTAIIDAADRIAAGEPVPKVAADMGLTPTQLREVGDELHARAEALRLYDRAHKAGITEVVQGGKR